MRNIIYGLADTRNDLIYYVGKTSVGKNRPLRHLTNSHSTEINNWIKTVREDWGDIEVKVLEEVEDLNDLPEREKYWIGYYQIINEKLLNKKDFPVLIETYTEEDDIKFHHLRSSIAFAGDLIRKRRLALNISQEELSEASGVSRSTLSLLENNENINSIKKVLYGLETLEMDKKIIDSIIKERSRK